MTYSDIALIIVVVIQISILILIRANQLEAQRDYEGMYQELARFELRMRELTRRIVNLERVSTPTKKDITEYYKSNSKPKAKRGRPRKKKDGDK